MTAPFTRVLIVDDHPLFCDALSLTLRAKAGVTQVETAGRLETALQRLGLSPSPDLILFDLHLPDVTGIDGLMRLIAVAGGVPVLVVSSLDDDRVVAAALAAGARGFLPKHAPREDLVAALDHLAQGQDWLPEGFVAPEDPGGATPLDRMASLTRQQARILHLICEGRLNKQIAFDLSISEATVKAHVTAILRKLGVQSRTQAVLLARGARFEAMLPDIGA